MHTGNIIKITDSFSGIILSIVSGLVISMSLHADPVLAQWKVYQLEFRYSGFTSKYSCDGIEYKLEKLILALGARDDVRVENSSCYGAFSEIQPYHKLLLAFSLPEIADNTEISADTFPAEWKQITLSRRNPRGLESGDCELVEQFAKQILPKLNIRDLENRTRCSPYKSNLHNPNLGMTLLMPVPESDSTRD